MGLYLGGASFSEEIYFMTSQYSSVISRFSPSHVEFEVHSPFATLLAYGHSVCRLRLSRMLLSASCRTSF